MPIVAAALLGVLAFASIHDGVGSMNWQGWAPPAADTGPEHKGLMPLEWWFTGALRLLDGVLMAALALVLVVPRPRARLWVGVLLLLWGAWVWVAHLWIRVPHVGTVDLSWTLFFHWWMPGVALLLPLPGILVLAGAVRKHSDGIGPTPEQLP